MSAQHQNNKQNMVQQRNSKINLPINSIQNKIKQQSNNNQQQNLITPVQNQPKKSFKKSMLSSTQQQQSVQEKFIIKQQMIAKLREFKKNCKEGKIFYKPRPGSRPPLPEENNQEFKVKQQKIRRKSCLCQRCGKMGTFQQTMEGKYPEDIIYQRICNEEQKQIMEQEKKERTKFLIKRVQRTVKVIELSNVMMKDQKEKEQELENQRLEEIKLQRQQQKRKNSMQPSPRLRKSVLLMSNNVKDSNGNIVEKRAGQSFMGAFLNPSNNQSFQQNQSYLGMNLSQPQQQLKFSSLNQSNQMQQQMSPVEVLTYGQKSSKRKLSNNNNKQSISQFNSNGNINNSNDISDDNLQLATSNPISRKATIVGSRKSLDYQQKQIQALIELNNSMQEEEKQKIPKKIYVKKEYQPTDYWKSYKNREISQSSTLLKDIKQQQKFAYKALADQGILQYSMSKNIKQKQKTLQTFTKICNVKQLQSPKFKSQQNLNNYTTYMMPTSSKQQKRNIYKDNNIKNGSRSSHQLHRKQSPKQLSRTQLNFTKIEDSEKTFQIKQQYDLMSTQTKWQNKGKQTRFNTNYN